MRRKAAKAVLHPDRADDGPPLLYIGSSWTALPRSSLPAVGPLAVYANGAIGRSRRGGVGTVLRPEGLPYAKVDIEFKR
jgi:hypothetical protein